MLFSSVNHLFLWAIYTMAMLVITRGYLHQGPNDLRRRSRWIGIFQRVIRVVVPGPQKTEPVAFEDSETMGILENLWKIVGKCWENDGNHRMENMLGGLVGYSVMIVESLWEND